MAELWAAVTLAAAALAFEIMRNVRGAILL